MHVVPKNDLQKILIFICTGNRWYIISSEQYTRCHNNYPIQGANQPCNMSIVTCTYFPLYDFIIFHKCNTNFKQLLLEIHVLSFDPQVLYVFFSLVPLWHIHLRSTFFVFLKHIQMFHRLLLHL